MADASSSSGDSGRTIDQHLENIASPGTRRTLRRVRRANQSSSANPPPTGSELWANAEEAITSRHQQQQTREQRKSAAEQEQVLVAASLRRAAAAGANNRSVFGINADDDNSNGIDDVDIDDVNNVNDPRSRSLIDSLEIESVINNDAAIVDAVDEINNGTFIIDGIDYRFRWKNWSNWFVVPPSY